MGNILTTGADFSGAYDEVSAMLTERLDPTLYYHGANHTLVDVLPAAEWLAKEEGITGNDLLCLRTAALFHDVGFLDQYEKNEPKGCDWARTMLPRFGYTQEQIDLVCTIIMATQLPQQPKTLLERVMCDADLSHLGNPEIFFLRTECLRMELNAHGKALTPRRWTEANMPFLEKQNWWSDAAQRLWTSGKQEVLRLSRGLLNGEA